MAQTLADARFPIAGRAVAKAGGAGGISTAGPAGVGSDPAARAAAAWNAPDAVAARKAEWERVNSILPHKETDGPLSETLRSALAKAKATPAQAAETPTPKAPNVYDLAAHQDVTGYIKARQKQSARAA